MEPSFITIPINDKIKFKKSDLEAIKDSENDNIFSDDIRVCNIFNVQYCLSIVPNESEEENRKQTWIYFVLELGSAIKIKANIKITSQGPSIKVNHMFKTSEDGWGDFLCATEELFNESKNFFIIDEMTVKVTGTLKIYLPPNKRIHPFSAQWKINKSDLEVLRTSTNDSENSLLSNKFEIFADSDINYQLEFCPNGYKEEQRGQAWILLQLNFASTLLNVKTQWSFVIDSAKFCYDLEYFFDKTYGYGINICSADNLFNPENKYFVDGEMIVEVNGTFVIENEKSASTECENVLDKNFPANDEKDFNIFVDEKSIKVHKQLLLDSSPYFIGMFNSGMIESTEMKTTVTDFDYEIVEAGIQILYDSKIPTQFTFEQLLELLRFSDKYDIQVIRDLVEKYFIKSVSPTNVCPLISFTSITVSAPRLHSKCMEYLIKCSKESKVIYGLETLDKDLLLKILKGTFIRKL